MSFAGELGNVAATLAGGLLPLTALTVWTPKNKLGVAVLATTCLVGSFLGNRVGRDQSTAEIKEAVRSRAAEILTKQGISQEELNQKFEQFYDPSAAKVGFARSFGNQTTTWLGAAVGGTVIAGLAGVAAYKAKGKNIKNIATDLGMDKLFVNVDDPESIRAYMTSVGDLLKGPKGAGAIKDFKHEALSIPFNLSGIMLASVAGTLLGGYLGNKAWQGVSKKAIEERSMDVVAKVLADRKAVSSMSQTEALQHRDQQRASSTEQTRH